MISALWLSLTLGIGAQPVAPAPRAAGDDPAIRVWLNEDGRFQRGDEAKAYVRTREDGYLVVLHVDPDNRLRVLFPLDPDDDNFVRGGKKYQILGRGDRATFDVDIRSGRGTVYAALSTEPFRFDGFVVGDHWDFRALNDVPLTRDVEADLNELIQRFATTDFDYDLVTYDVYERVYASGYGHSSVYYTPSYYSSAWDPYYSSWCVGYWGCGGSRLFIGIGIGYPYSYYPFAYYPYSYYPFSYYPFSYYHYPTYYYPFRPFRPYFPFRYRDPFRYRGYGTYYAGGYYFGGHYAAPWRNRVNDRFYGSSYVWRGREATTDLAKPGRFATGYRERGFDRGVESGKGGPRVADASPRRRSEVPAPNITPTRTADRRPAATVLDNPSRAPEGRRATERGGERGGRNEVSAPLPVRVGAGASGSDGAGEARRAEPRRSEEVRGPSRERDYAARDANDRRRGYKSGVIEGRREVEGRGPEARGPSRAREAVDDRPSPRESRERPNFEPRPAPRSESRPEPRIEPRPQPRAEPRRETPPPRVDAPRAEPRSHSAYRGDRAGRGRPNRRN